MRRHLLIGSLALLVSMTASTTDAAGPRGTRRATDAGISFLLPRGFHVIQQRLTPVVEPIPRLAVGTFAVRTGRHLCVCATPNVVNLPSDGAWMMLWAYPHVRLADLRRVPPRPRRFTITTTSQRHYECDGPSWMTAFRMGDSSFEADVYLGQDATRQLRVLLEALLDSLRLSPTPSSTARGR